MGLDLVELMMVWEQAFGINIPDSEAAALRTPRDVTNLILRGCDRTSLKIMAAYRYVHSIGFGSDF